MAEPIKCAACKRPFRADMKACPFCKTEVAAARPRTPFELAAEQVAQSNRMFMDLDFTMASLVSLELFMDETWGAEPTPMTPARENVVRSFGCYLGETLRRSYGGSWRDDATLDLGLLVFAPLRVVHDRFVRGAAASIEVQIKALRSRLPQRAEDPNAWARQAAFFDRVQRSDLSLVIWQRLLSFPLDARSRAQVAERVLCAKAAAVAKPPVKEAFEVEEKILRGSLDLLGLELDGSVASLTLIDLWFDTTYGPDPLTHEQKRAPKYLDDELHVGAYLGNLLCARFGANWELDEREPRTSHVVWPSGFRTCPFAFPSKRADNGKGWGIHHQFETMRSMLVQRGELLPPGAEEAAQWLALAERFRDRNPSRPGLVRDAFARAFELDPKLRPQEPTVESLLRDVERLARDGKTEEAVAVYRKLCEIAPKAEWFREMGVGLALLGRFDEGLEALDRAIALDPSDSAAWDHKAVTLGRVGRYADGVAVLDAAPQDARILSRRAFFLTRVSRYAEARESADRAIALEPSRLDAWIYRGEAERLLGHTAAAVVSFRHFVARSFPSERTTQVQRLIHKLENPSAVLETERAQALHDQAFSLSLGGRRIESLPLFAESMRLDPTSFMSWNNYGTVLSELGREEEAVDCYDRAIELAPRAGLVHHNRSMSLARLGQMTEALEAIDRALVEAPSDKALLSFKSRLLRALGRSAEADALS
ncbi:MAG: tetratricopeptide repeat protein [Polyangiales bacterium]